MRISLQDADAARLDIDLSVDGEVRRVSLTGLHAVVGQLERGTSAARVRPLRVDSVVLAALEWPLPAGGRLSITSPAALAGLAIELDAAAEPDASPLSGRLSAVRADADAVALDLPAGARLAFDAELHQARVEHTPERVGYTSAEKVEVGNLQAVLGGLVCRLSTAVLDHARVDWQAGEVLVGVGLGTAGGITVTSPATGVTVEVDRIELPGGLRTSAGVIVIPELVVPELRISVNDVMELFRPDPAAPKSPPPRARVTGQVRAEPPGFDLGFLDRVSGRLDVDMTLDISLPVIGRREATHHFRVPITRGIINYRELERDLANFEDAFIDVEVRGQSLVIERAIPLIPGLEKPLVVWDLDAEELELARRRLVRLRTVPRLRLVGGGKSDRSEKSSLAVRSLRFDSVDIAIALAAPAEDETDSIGRASAGELRVTGRLAYEPQVARGARETTTASLTGSSLAAGPVELAGGRIAADSVELGQLASGTVTFSGLRPGGASLTGRDLRVRNLRISTATPTRRNGPP